MAAESAPGTGERRARGAELLIPLLAFAFTVYYVWSIQGTPWTAKVSAYLIGSILVLLLAVFSVRVLVEVARGRAGLGVGAIAAPRTFLVRRLTLLVLTLAYVLVLEWGGFTLTTAVFLYLAMLVLGGWRIQRAALALSLTYALGGYLLFVVAFQTRFPAGPFENLMKQLF